MSGWLLRRAAVRPRVLVVGCPYGTRVRLLAEAEAGRRGWAAARAPAEAGVLVVCGTPGDEMAAAVDHVWDDMPGPRALAELAPDVPESEVAAALDRAVEVLGDERAQDADRPAGMSGARGADRPAGMSGARGADRPAGMSGVAGGDRSAGPPGERTHGGDGHMGAAGGVGMAARGPDRDGLQLDRLHVPLGPVLADWPAGLVVETVMQGDVIQEAVVRVVPPGRPGGVGFWDEPRRRAGGVRREEAGRRAAAARLDSLGRLLGVAGWPAAARDARSLRDRLLAGSSAASVRRDYERFSRRVRRSRVLRWMLRGAGVVDGGPGWMRGDVLDRAYRWLDSAGAALDALDGRTRAGAAGHFDGSTPVAALSLLPGLLAGAELAVGRLVVASLDPDVEQLPAGPAVASE
ncbi:hypothetical protein [Nonomuraea sp. NPDC049709]|uniref:hypothetical protein n=1 Tax=Nonomuraea sp. NPDC049709 TaxID=3154736 RepID=UPI00341FF7D6